MNAKEMFEEQRYKRNEENEEITYSQRFGSGYFRITFDLSKEEIAIDTNMENVIESDLLQAIIQQAKELGWVEEEKQEIKQETNIDHYKDGIIELCVDDLAISKGKVVKCCAIPCSECDFEDKNGHCIGNREIMKWLKQPYIKPVYKLTKFEIDLLQSCSQGYSPKYQFKNINSLTEMRKNGYFKGVNRDATIEEIIAKSEVLG